MLLAALWSNTGGKTLLEVLTTSLYGDYHLTSFAQQLITVTVRDDLVETQVPSYGRTSYLPCGRGLVKHKFGYLPHAHSLPLMVSLPGVGDHI